MINFIQNIPSKYTFFSGANGSFSRIDHVLENSTSLNKFRRLKLYQAFSDHDGMKLQINYKEKLEKYIHMKQHAT